MSKYRPSFTDILAMIPLAFFLLVVLFGCGVKEKEAATAVVAAQGLPPGMHISEKGAYVVSAQPPTLVPNEENTVTFRFVDQTLLPIAEEFDVTTDYRMPSMAMDIVPATARKVGPGLVEFVYTIAHGGEWEVTLYIRRNGQVVDKVVFRQDLPK